MPNPGTRRPLRGYSPFHTADTVKYNRLGKKIQVRGQDGTFQESDTVEANLLYDILRVLEKPVRRGGR